MSSISADDLFGECRFFTLPAGEDFLGALSKTLIDVTGAREKPEALADCLIFVPNRRSARALAGRLFQEMNMPGFLPPDIRPLGDAGDNDPALLGELAEVDVRPAIPEGARIGALTRLVLSWHQARGDEVTLASAMSVAADLARLLDQAALAGGVNWSKLETLTMSADLAQHWQMLVDFFSIIVRQWPDFLEENGFSDANEQDRLAAEAMCARWQNRPPQSPVLVVGSTGTSPATRMLMAGAASLPRGAVLFPGLDLEIDSGTWSSIEDTPSHPQHAFAETLAALDVELSGIRLWPGFEEDPTRLPRRKLIQESLAPADVTADWVSRLEGRAAPLSRRDMTQAGLEGLSLIEAETEAEEADAISLLIREALEDDKARTVALVTPDAGLSRRVSALMKQWGVEVLASAGQPLLRTRAGQFLLRVLDFVLDPGDPVALAALLKHDLAVFLVEEDRQKAVSCLERGLLRGLRRWTDFESLTAWYENQMEKFEEEPFRAPLGYDDLVLIEHLLDDIRDRTQDIRSRLDDMLAAPFGLRGFVETLAELADTLSREVDHDGPSMLWSGEDGSRLARFLEETARMGDFLDEISKDDLKPVLTSLAQSVKVPPDRPGHPGVHIWGPLEARLQSCDLVILGSLNEGVWPEPPAIDGFLPRHFRSEIGLPDTEARIGLSAHDFAQLACAPRVVMTRAKRVENKPSVASRWLWRLRILASGALESLEETDRLLTTDTAHVLDWARARHLSDAPVQLDPPEPRPPVALRPRKIKVTEVKTLIRDPYAFYASRVLELEPLDPLNKPLGPKEIGIAMHKAVEVHDKAGSEEFAVDAILKRFEEELEDVGGDTLFFAEREGIWTTAARTLHDWMVGRDGQTEKRYSEIDYVHEMEIAGGVVTLRGHADLVETRQDGQLAITDFKTGRPPSIAQVKTGLEPQLPLLAVLAEKGTAKSGPIGQSAELIYFGLGTKTGAVTVEDKNYPAPRLIDEAEQGFTSLMTAYLTDTQPYLSGPRVQFAAEYSDYDRLARRSEWADAGAETGGDG